MYKVRCLNAISRKGIDLMEGKYEFTENIGEADAVLVRSAAMHDMEVPDSLLCVARAGAGVNNIPLDDYAKRGIVVFNTPGANANAVKELVIAGLMMAARDIHGGMEWIEERREDENIAKDVEKVKKQFAGTEIYGKTLGVIGLGAIGVMVANAATNLGMRVLGYDPYLSVDNAWRLSRHVNHCKELHQLLSECDYVTVHVPAMESTKGMIDRKAIESMKEGSVVLNFARDILVDEEALAEALEAGRVRKYVTDFPNARSVKMKNTLVLPHLGASTAESEENCAEMAAQEIMDYLENGNIRNSVNYPNCDFGPVESPCRIAIFNENVPNMISQFTSVLANQRINIVDLGNKSKGNVAYTLINTDQDVTEETVKRLMEIDGVFRVRVIRA
jgi:D-3-phosphoglycerate dehydrogenase